MNSELIALLTQRQTLQSVIGSKLFNNDISQRWLADQITEIELQIQNTIDLCSGVSQILDNADRKLGSELLIGDCVLGHSEDENMLPIVWNSLSLNVQNPLIEILVTDNNEFLGTFKSDATVRLYGTFTYLVARKT